MPNILKSFTRETQKKQTHFIPKLMNNNFSVSGFSSHLIKKTDVFGIQTDVEGFCSYSPENNNMSIIGR